MTNLALTNKDDYPAAAEKHLNDAEALLGAGRFDGAGYLLGYAVECSLRTVLMVGAMARLGPIRHDRLAAELRPASSTLKRFKATAAREVRSVGREHNLADLASATTSYARELNSATVDYAPPIDTKKPPFRAWTHSLRYRAEGAIAEAEAKAWLAEADEVYKKTIGRMLRNGVIQR